MDPDQGAFIEMRLFLLFRDADEYEILDTWHASGLKGTGSHDIKVAEQFIPAHRTIAWSDVNRQPTENEVFLQGAGVHDSAWYYVPALDWMHWTITPALAGAAWTAIEASVERYQTRTNLFQQRLADTQSVQLRLADAAARVEHSILSVKNDVAECSKFANARQTPPRLTRARWRRNSAFQAIMLNEAMSSLRYRDGFNGNFLHQTLQRAHRDIAAGAAHVGTDWDLMGGTYGRTLLGVEDPSDPLAV